MRFVLKTAQLEVSEVGDVFVVRWRQEPSVAALLAIEEAMFATLDRHPNGFAALVVSRSRDPREPTFLREASAQVERLKAKGLRAIAAVQDDDSMRGKLARVALQVLSSMSRGTDIRIFRYLPAACVWMAARVPGVDAASLEGEARRPAS